MSLTVYDYHGNVDGDFTEDAPRPPVPGEEDGQVFQFKDDGQFSSKTPSHWPEVSTATAHRSDPNLGSTSRDSPYEPWAETLLALLDDQDGTVLFQHFLRGRGCSELLDFWFACRGFCKFPAGTAERRLRLAKAIYRCYLSERSLSIVSRRVTTMTRCNVLDAIGRSQLDSSLFAQACAEVQALLEQDMFPLFLRSDEFLKHAIRMPTKLPSSTDTGLPAHLATPSPEKEVEPETENRPSYNVANQKSRDYRTCRTTRDREKTHTHLPHTPVKMRTHTFMCELMRRLHELQTQTLVVEQEADVTDRMSGPAHSLLHYDISAESPLHTRAHAHSADALDCVETHTRHYGSTGESVTVVYYLCGEMIPYRTCVQGNRVTLAQFKSLLNRKGSYRFFFKRWSSEFECGAVYEEIREDDSVLPIYQHKIIAKVQRINE